MQDNEVSKKVQVEALGEQLHQMIKYFTWFDTKKFNNK
jgi:hypothetical protein